MGGETTIVTATEFQNNIGKFFGLVAEGEQIQIVKNGKPFARIVPEGEAVSFLSDSLRGILKNGGTWEEIRDQRLEEMYDRYDRLDRF